MEPLTIDNIGQQSLFIIFVTHIVPGFDSSSVHADEFAVTEGAQTTSGV